MFKGSRSHDSLKLLTRNSNTKRRVIHCIVPRETVGTFRIKLRYICQASYTD
jgi:hypothetical protein